MDAKEGFRRLNKLGQVLGTTGVCLTVVGIASLVVDSMRISAARWFGGMEPFAVFGVYLLFTGLAVVIVSWIGEGFVKKE